MDDDTVDLLLIASGVFFTTSLLGLLLGWFKVHVALLPALLALIAVTIVVPFWLESIDCYDCYDGDLTKSAWAKIISTLVGTAWMVTALTAVVSNTAGRRIREASARREPSR